MSTELAKYLKQDVMARKKLEQERDEERMLRILKNKYDKSETLSVEDIKDATKILFKATKEAYENKDSFTKSYIADEKINIEKFKSGKIDLIQYCNNQYESLRVHDLYTNEIQQKIDELDLHVKYLNYQMTNHLNECNGYACISNSTVKYKDDVNESDIVCKFIGFCQQCVDQAHVVDYAYNIQLSQLYLPSCQYLAYETVIIHYKFLNIFELRFDAYRNHL